MARPLSAMISQTALAHNLARVRHFAPEAKVMAMIKANGYGHGLIHVAKTLASADAFGVACIEEAMQLRAGGITNEIVLIEGIFTADEVPLVAKHQLTQVIHSFEQIEVLRRYEAPASTFPVWIKINTGMNRLGFSAAAFEDAYVAIKNIPSLSVIGYMTQFVKADDRADPLTTKQIVMFDKLVGDKPGQKCLANSAGILGWPDSHRDWVRPGIMLYGASPFSEDIGTTFGLKPTLSLSTRIIALQSVGLGESVGYAGVWQSKRENSVIAILALGYGDGYPRQAQNGTPVLVKGKRAQIVGRVSMDMLAVDVTDIPDSKVGDEVILWGEGLPIEEVAAAMGTLPNEIYCRCTNGRYPIHVAKD